MVATTPRIRVTVQPDGTVRTENRVIRDTTIYANRASRVIDLNDVNLGASEFAEGATLVYNLNSQTFTIKLLPSDAIMPIDSVDGGQF